MKKTKLLITSLSILLWACQKEVTDPAAPVTTGNTNGTKLIRTISKNGSESSTADYTYDTNNRLIGLKNVGTTNGVALNTSITWQRNSSGIVIAQVFKDPNLLATTGVDSTVTTYGYDASQKRYTYARLELNVGGLLFIDSTAYVYDAANKLVSSVDYVSTVGISSVIGKNDYSYTGSNLTGIKIYNYNSVTSVYDLNGTVSYEYDNKISPLQFVADAVPLGISTYYSANNPVKVVNAYPALPSQNLSFTTSFTYNGNNRPATGNTTGSYSSTGTFYYQ